MVIFFNMGGILFILFLLYCFHSTKSALSDDADFLRAAAEGDVSKVINFAKNKGVSLTTKNNNGVSAIIFAANNGHVDVVKELVSLGVDIEDRSNNWKTPLLWASLWGHFPVVKYLVSRGANISASDVYGLTPVMSATMSGNVKLVEYLIQQGANVTAKNYYNGTAYSIAVSKKNEEMLKILRPYFPDEEDRRNPYEVLYSLLYENILFYLNLFLSEIKSIFVGHENNIKKNEL